MSASSHETAGETTIPSDRSLPDAMERLLEELAVEHDGAWQSLQAEGLRDLLRPAVELIIEHVGRNQLRVIETGAGLSTLAFLAMDWSLTSVSLGEHLGQRIAGHIDRLGLKSEDWEFINARSEIVLPGLREQRFDVALMDGGRGWPTVFVDFCYLNATLRKGGLLLINDAELHSVRELVELLRVQPGFRIVRDATRLRAFIKETDARFLPDFDGQPYLKAIPVQWFSGPRRSIEPSAAARPLGGGSPRTE